MLAIDGSRLAGRGPIATSTVRVSSSDSNRPGLCVLSSTSRSLARSANSSIRPGAACSANRADVATRSSRRPPPAWRTSRMVRSCRLSISAARLARRSPPGVKARPEDGTDEQLVAELLAQLADVQRHGGLGDLQVGGGPLDRTQPHHRGEGAQLSRRHPLPFVRPHDDLQRARTILGPPPAGGRRHSLGRDHPGSRPVVSGPVVGALYSPIHSSFHDRSYCCSLQLGR